MLQPRYQQHPNGARGIAAVILCDPSPDETAARYARIAGHEATQEGDARVIDLGRARLIVLAPDGLGAMIPNAAPPLLPYFAGFIVTVDDLAPPRRILMAAAIPFAEEGGRIVVAATEAFGCAVLFEGKRR